MLQSKNPPALSSDKVREHSVHPDLFWKLGLAKLYGSGLLQAEEFPGHLLLLLIRDQAGEEGKQDQGAAEILVVVLQQSFLSQNFINRLELDESLDHLEIVVGSIRASRSCKNISQ